MTGIHPMTEPFRNTQSEAEAQRPLAMVTGASRGIGRATALALAEAGYNLFLIARKEAEKLKDTAERCRSLGARVETRCADIGDCEACEDIFTALDLCPGSFKLLVANAGISKLGLLQDLSPEEWDAMLRTDLSSCFYLSRLAIPRMLRTGGGKLIFISSVWGSRGASCEVAYSAAKGGVNAFTKALAKELAPSNIQVNAIAPGAIDTDMNAWLTEEERAVLEEEIPAGRMGLPEEVAALVCQIAAAPAYLTGNILTLSGGWEI
jgi:3-oxoacyl-[acyl-carrier-protein] reductase